MLMQTLWSSGLSARSMSFLEVGTSEISAGF